MSKDTNTSTSAKPDNLPTALLLPGYQKVLLILFCVIFTLILLVPISPTVIPYPGMDSSFFIFIAKVWKNGGIPYIDAFDHKGPVIYLINLIGLYLGDLFRGPISSDYWGVWTVETIFMFMTLLIATFIMARRFSIFPAILAILVTFSGFHEMIISGNFTEEYALLGSFVCITLFFRQPEIDHANSGRCWRAVLFGIAFGFLFLLRPNNIGVALSAMLALWGAFILQKTHPNLKSGWLAVFIARLKRPLITTFLMLIGFSLFVGGFVYYFSLHGGVDDLYMGTIGSNLAYVGTRGNLVDSYANGLKYHPYTPYVLLPALILVVFDATRDFRTTGKVNAFRIFVLISFPIDLFLTGVSNRYFNHYYISWIPSLSIMIAYLLDRMLKIIKPITNNRQNLITLSLIVISVVTAFRLYQHNLNTVRALISDPHTPVYSRIKLSENIQIPYVENLVQIVESDQEIYNNPHLLVWGVYTPVYYLELDKPAPHPNFFFPMLLRRGFYNLELLQDFQNSVVAKKPLIVVTKGVPPPEAHRWEWDKNWYQFIQWIEENYYQVEPKGDPMYPLDDYEWVLYAPRQ